MPISENRTILQVIVSNRTDDFINHYCQLFDLSKSQFCNLALCEKIISLLDKEVPYEKKTSQN